MKVYLSYYWRESNHDYDNDVEQGFVGVFSTYMLALEAGREYCKKRSIAHTHFKSSVAEFYIDKVRQ